jgi:hypothetical protein
MARPVFSLNRVLLTTKAGRRPFYSWPDWGSKVTDMNSPFLGMCDFICHVSLPDGLPQTISSAL